MSTEPAVLVLLRETLEQELDDAAATILFDALNAFGTRVPASFAEVVELVHGPLRERLVARYGTSRAATLIRQLERTLRLAEQPTQELSSVRAKGFDSQTTRSLPALTGGLEVIVVSGSRSLAERLGALFNRQAVRFVPVQNAGDLARLDAEHAIALIDATEPPKASPRALAASLRAVSVVMVWGSDSESAKDLLAAFQRENLTMMSFPSDETIEPLLDVIRSRITA